MSNDLPSGGPERPSPRERVQLPAIFLMIAGSVNLLAALLVVVTCVQLLNMPEDELLREFRIQLEQMPQERRQALPPELATPEGFWGFFKPILQAGIPGAAVAALLGVLAILGGVRMQQLRSHGLAIAGAVGVSIPFLSPLGCCLMGEAIGIWCLVVLLSRDVSASFGASPPPPPGPPFRR